MIDNQAISDFLRAAARTNDIHEVPPVFYGGGPISGDEDLERRCEWCAILPVPRPAVLETTDISDIWHRLLREVPAPLRDARCRYSITTSHDAAYSHGDGMESAFSRNEVLFRLSVRFPAKLAQVYGLPHFQIVPLFRASLFDESDAKAHSHTNGRKLYVPVVVYEHMGSFGEVEWTLAYDAQGAPCVVVRKKASSSRG